MSVRIISKITSCIIFCIVLFSLTLSAQSQPVTARNYRKLLQGYFVIDSLFSNRVSSNCKGFIFLNDSVIQAISPDSCKTYAYFKWISNDAFTLDKSKPSQGADLYFHSYSVISYADNLLQLIDFCEAGQPCPSSRQQYWFLRKRK